MLTAEETVPVSPGQDHEDFDKEVLQEVADEASKALGATIYTANIAPIITQAPVVPINLNAKPEFQAGISEHWDGQKGRPRTNLSKGPLNMFVERVRKLHPGKEVELKAA